MNISQLQSGDVVFAKERIVNDGSVPGLEQNAVIAEPGTRGVIINQGHFEDVPKLKLILIRFENADKSLGPAIGCWPYELESREQ